MKSIFQTWKANFLELLDAKSVSPSAQKMILTLIILACLGIRLISIDAPRLDRTLWKEIDYIMISQNYWQHGFKFFQPEISWPAEPPRVTPMELPLVPYLAGMLYAGFGFNAYSARMIPLLAYLLLTVYVFRLAKRELGPLVGLLAALCTAMMPLYHQFGKILFSEPIMIAVSVVALFHFAQWVDFRKKRDWVLALLGFSLAISLKLTPLYLLLPLLWIAFRKYGFKLNNYTNFFIFILLSLVVPIAWYAYAYYLTIHSIDVFGIFGGHDKMQTFTMLSDYNWYYVMVHRIGRDILGGKLGSFLCFIGVISAIFTRKADLFVAYLLAIGIFFIIVAEGQIDAPYRQLTIVPAGSVFVALGTTAILSMIRALIGNKTSPMPVRKPRKSDLWLCFILVCLIAPFKIYNTAKSGPFMTSHNVEWEFAQEIKKFAGSNAKLVAAGEYTIHKGGNDLSPVIYYHSGLQGWTLQKGDWDLKKIKKLINRGGTVFAAKRMSREPDSSEFLREMKVTYKTLYENSEKELLLLDLNQPLTENQ